MDALLIYINKLYGLDLRYLEQITKGALSENHILIDGDTKYFLKKYRFDNEERIREVHLVKKYFFDGGIPVIFPLINKDESTFFVFDGGYFALFPFIADKQLERKELTPPAIVFLGEMLGRIHLLGRAARLPIKDKFNPWRKEITLQKIEFIEAKIKQIAELTDFDTLVMESVAMKKRLVQENMISYEDLHLPSDHLIHGDYLDHNVFFGSDDHVSHVFDFEKTSYSPRVWELFRSMMYSFLSDDINSENIDRAKLYLDAYLKIYPVSHDELQRGLKLYYLKSIHGVWTESEHYLQGNQRADKFLTTDFRRIKYLMEKYAEFEGELLG